MEGETEGWREGGREGWEAPVNRAADENRAERSLHVVLLDQEKHGITWFLQQHKQHKLLL